MLQKVILIQSDGVDEPNTRMMSTLLSQVQEPQAGQMGLVITDEGATAEGWGL